MTHNSSGGGLDQTELLVDGENKADPDQPSQQSQKSQPEIASSEKPAKKSMPGFLKALIWGTLVLMLVAGAAVGYLLYMKQNQSAARWAPVNDPAVAVEAEVSPTSQVQSVMSPQVDSPSVVSEPMQPVQAAIPIVPNLGAAGSSSERSLVGNGGDQSHLAEYAFEGQPSLLTEKENSEELYESVLALVSGVEDKQTKFEKRFESFDIAATALHKRHAADIKRIADQKDRHENSLMDVTRKLHALEKKLAALQSNDQSLAKVEAFMTGARKEISEVKAQGEKNQKNIKWISYTRLCAAEKELGLNRYAKYCGFKKEQAKASTPKPQAALAPTLNTQPQIRSGSSEVPATVGRALAPQPQANVIQSVSSNVRVGNPCTYANREWKLSLISNSQALLHRRVDGYESIVDMNTSIPGLGRAQLFNAHNYPQYVQFTNAVVCGG